MTNPSHVLGVVGGSLIDPNSPGDADGAGLPIGLIVGFAVVTAVFVFGLSQIRKQRASGRTRKFPRIG